MKKEVKAEPEVIDATMSSEDEDDWDGVMEEDDEEVYIEIDSD